MATTLDRHAKEMPIDATQPSWHLARVCIGVICYLIRLEVAMAVDRMLPLARGAKCAAVGTGLRRRYSVRK